MARRSSSARAIERRDVFGIEDLSDAFHYEAGYRSVRARLAGSPHRRVRVHRGAAARMDLEVEVRGPLGVARVAHVADLVTGGHGTRAPPTYSRRCA